VGTWSEYAHVHYLDCAILPDDADPEEYSGSMVNTITPYAFLKMAQDEGHKGIISTAGTSATGKAMIGICLTYNFPLISIVRNEQGKQELEELGAKNILVQEDPDFNQQLNQLGQELSATAIFEGIGGEILNRIMIDLPNNSVIYSYGYLGDSTPLNVHLSAFVMKNLTLKFYSNFRSKTVQDITLLEQAIQEINGFIHMPHFKTTLGKRFKPEEINEAIAYAPGKGQKAVIRFE
jgi:NADPH:quinone reductase-like Zn-dependent oxidoreductase